MSDHTVTLSDGRTLGYAEFGVDAGTPIFYCHGLPGSRLEAALATDAARSLGLRIIAPDRPGFGRSTFHARQGISNWARDLEQLADHLQVERFNLLGVSGGGPYAVACAQYLSDRADQLALVCPLGPLATVHATDGMSAALSTTINWARRLRVLVNVYGVVLGTMGRHWPEFIINVYERQASEADRAVLAEPRVRAVIAASVQEAFRQGGRGPAQELALHLLPWDIDPVQVKVRVLLWQGEADTTVPPVMGHWYAQRLPNCQLRSLPGEGHFSVPVRHMNSILRTFACAPTQPARPSSRYARQRPEADPPGNTTP